jgi:hypothetical protein
MARSRGKVELSLFPFLNILFSLIGVLILYIFVILVMGRATGRASVQEGQRRGQAAARAQDRDLEELKKRHAELETTFEKKTRELRDLKLEQDQLEVVLDLRRRQDLMPAAGTGTVGVPIGAPIPKEWQLVPVARKPGELVKEPVLVEVTADQYIAYDFGQDGPPRKTAYPIIGSPGAPEPATPKAGPRPGARKRGDPKPEPAGPGQADPRLAEFLDGIHRQRRAKYLLLLVRPEGIDGLRRIVSYIVPKYPTQLSDNVKDLKPSERFDFGFEPFSDQWLLLRKAKDERR